MCPSFTILKKRNHCHLLSKRVARKKIIEERLQTNTAPKNLFTASKKSKVIHAYKFVCDIAITGKKTKEKTFTYKLQQPFFYIHRCIL